MSTFSCPVVRYTLSKISNSDHISLATIEGWNCVVRTEDFIGEQFGVYIPINAIAEKEHPLLGFLAGKRIRTVKLRGIISQGILLPYTQVLQYLHQLGIATEELRVGDNLAEVLQIKKYIPPVNNNLGYCDEISPPEGLDIYTEIESWKHFPNVIKEGGEVILMEKLHGAGSRYALINNNFYVGSRVRTLVLDDYINTKGETVKLKPTAWHIVAEKFKLKEKLEALKNKIKSDCITIYGEIFGPGIQKLHYGQEGYAFRVFDIKINGKYLNPLLARTLAMEVGLEVVPELYRGPFKKELLELRLGLDTISSSHVREGFVIEPLTPRWDPELGRVKLKVVSEEYDLKYGGIEVKDE